VVVDGEGVVTASPTPDYAAAIRRMPAGQAQIGWGVVVVSHEDAAAGRYGFASVPVVVRDARAR
jgi:hypothetical protein